MMLAAAALALPLNAAQPAKKTAKVKKQKKKTSKGLEIITHFLASQGLSVNPWLVLVRSA